MSYILEALRKAERQERRGGRVPTLATEHPSGPARLRRWWPWALVAAVALNAAVLHVVLRSPGPVELPPATVASRQERTPARSAVPPAPAVLPSVSARPPAPETRAPVSSAAEPRVAERGAPGRAEPEGSSVPPPPLAPLPPARPSVPETGVAAAARPVEAPPVAAPAAPPAPGAPTAPPARAAGAPAAAVASAADPGAAGPQSADTRSVLQEALSRMTLDVLVYSEHAPERFVFISGRKYVEGQRIDGRFLLEAITEEGAVLSHEGQRQLLSPRRNPYRPPGRGR